MEEQVKNVASCSLPIKDKKVYPERFFRGETLHCREYGQRNRVDGMVICDQCQEGYHIWCLSKPLDDVTNITRHLEGVVRVQEFTKLPE